MRTLYLFNVTVHLLAAFLWLGGMFLLAAVGAPVLRKVEPASLRAQLFGALGQQFRTVGWACIAVLLATGLANLWFVRVFRGGRWADPAFWASPYGRTLAWKLAAVAIMVGVSAVHDFIHGPAATRMVPGTAEALRMRRRASWLARINALVGIVLVAAAVRLARGG